MRSGRIHFWLLIETRIDLIKTRRQVASHIEPPVAHENGLRELSSIRTQETGLSSIYVTIMPTYFKIKKNENQLYIGGIGLNQVNMCTLASCVHIGKKSRIWLIITVETCVRHRWQHWIIRSWSTWNNFFGFALLVLLMRISAFYWFGWFFFCSKYWVILAFRFLIAFRTCAQIFA